MTLQEANDLIRRGHIVKSCKRLPDHMRVLRKTDCAVIVGPNGKHAAWMSFFAYSRFRDSAGQYRDIQQPNKRRKK